MTTSNEWPNQPAQNSAAVGTETNPLLEKLVMKLATEQTRARRWQIFFKILLFVYLFLLFGLAAHKSEVGTKEAEQPHTAMVRIEGMIGEGQGMGVSADQAIAGIRRAFEAKSAKSILLRINSPGGTPVNAAMVYDEINRLRALNPDKKVYAAITDVGASGAYYIAAAADFIYANETSVVGSIGVISQGYGFVGLMEKLGVERRIYSAGDNKAMLDPFSPLKETQRQHFNDVLGVVHDKFMEDVKKGRQGKLDEDDATIFSGLFWSGRQAKELGLIDGFASPGGVARDIIGQKDIVDYTQTPQGLARFLEMFSASLVSMAVKVDDWRDAPVRAQLP